MIDTRALTFLSVCKHLNYTRAAEELNLSQPAVSQHIRYLEDYYQVKLFDYKNKNLKLTEQGVYLKKYMETICHDFNHIKSSIKNIEKRYHLNLGATLSIGEYYLPDRLSLYIKKHPETDLSVTVDDTKTLLGMLEQGLLDIVLCEGYFNKNEYEHTLIKNEEMCIFCSNDYDISSIHCLEDLFSHHILIRGKGSGTREIFERYLYERNYSLECFSKISEITSPHLIIRLLLDKQGINVLYKTVGHEYLLAGSLQEIKLNKFNLSHEFNAVWNKNTAFDDEYRLIVKDLINVM